MPNSLDRLMRRGKYARKGPSLIGGLLAGSRATSQQSTTPSAPDSGAAGTGAGGSKDPGTYGQGKPTATSRPVAGPGQHVGAGGNIVQGQITDPSQLTDPGTVTAQHRGEVVGSMEDMAQQVQDLTGGLAEGQEERYGQVSRDIDAFGRAGASQAGLAMTDTQAAAAKAELLPQQVKADIDQYVNQFRQNTTQDLSYLKGQAEEAKAAVMEGRNAAAQAAVQGIHSNIQDQLSRVQADPNLSPTQKQQMMSQIRMSGAQGIAATVGANIKDWSALQADTINKSMSTIGGVMSSFRSTEAQLGATAISAIERAHEASAQLGAEFQKMENGIREWYTGVKQNVADMRLAASTAQNGDGLALLPHQTEAIGLGVDAVMADMILHRDSQNESNQWWLHQIGFDEAQGAAEEARAMNTRDFIFSLIEAFV